MTEEHHFVFKIWYYLTKFRHYPIYSGNLLSRDTYILTNKKKTVLYTGVTSNLYARVHDHKNGQGSVFTKKYKCTILLYYEFSGTMEEAIHREKRIKKYSRAWKENLINAVNPLWDDLFSQVEEMQ